MATTGGSLSRTVSLAATILVAVVVLLPPAIFYVVSYEHTAGVVEAEAEINARIVSRIVTANPELWQYETVRFGEYLARRPVTHVPERRRVLDARGAKIAEDTDPLPRPWLTRSVPLFDAGAVVGRLEVSRSLRPLIYRSVILALSLLAVGLLSFRAVRTIPLRAIQRSQGDLRRERDTAQRYLDVAGVAFLIVDEAGRVRLLNRKGCEILGRAAFEVIGKDWLSTFVDPADRPRVAAVTAAAHPDHVGAITYAVRRPDGGARLVSWVVTPLVDAEGRRTGVLASGKDVTHEAELEERVRKANQLEAIGRVASGVAHDFSNVLAVIKMRSELLRRQFGAEQDPRRRHVEDVLAAVERGAALTRDLLTFGRQRTGRPEPADVVELLRRSEQPLRDLVPESVELRLELPAEPLRAMVEPVELDRVLTNLVTNARDALPEGGRIVVSARRTTIDAAAAAEAGLARPGMYAEISVADTGTGIPPEVRANLFEPFFTTKEPGKGTGLGLSIAYAIMKQHGGAIRVESEPGAGATFTLLLPLMEGDGAPAAAEA